MSKTVVLGIGNLIQSDDGVGVHVVRKLQDRADLPHDVEIIDGGTAGLGLLHCLEDVSRLIVVDAIEMDLVPGTLVRLGGGAVPAYLSLKMSPHQIGLPDLLFAAKLRDLYPQEVVIWGMQPATIDTGLDLSAPVSAHLDLLADKVVGEVQQAYMPDGDKEAQYGRIYEGDG